MEQLTQKLKDGTMQVLEVPTPALRSGMVLVRNHYSLISAGTETSTVKAARKGYLGKAMERPQQFRQVVETLKSQGFVQTYRAVMKKLDAYSSLGYSCAGEVIDLSEDAAEFRIGDRVACGGLTACHAEVVAVPANLCVRLRDDADLRQSAYNTLGAIAMQGVRQASLQLGETCAVIGLGLLGQLTGLLLKASGVRVVGVDIDPSMVELAAKHFSDCALIRSDSGIEQKILHFTRGLGCDAVIITAASQSLDPINFAGVIARKKGTIVVVGAVPTGFDREPHFYKKELQIKMSCSYGPGRYDPVYEEKGVDYPAAYVRWTENRNMLAFQDLVSTGSVDVSYLTTHLYSLEEAPAAYEMLLNKQEPFVGILIEYDAAKPLDRTNAPVRLKDSHNGAGPPKVGIGFIGAGSYAQSHLLPNLPKGDGVVLRGVMNTTGASARSVGERFGFDYCTANADDILQDEAVNTVFIASRHDSHADYVMAALNAGKHVFVEKPLCITEDELRAISNLYQRIVESGQRPPILMVGYNRRFSPLANMIRCELGAGTMAMLYRINAGSIPRDSWIQDPKWGGGRIIGEVCHFVDFMNFVNGSLPVSVYASAMTTAENLHDTVNICLSYQNGSTGSISYFANGDKSMSKEYFEVFSNGCICALNDFKALNIYANGKRMEKKLVSQNKGQANQITSFIDAVQKGRGECIPFDQIYSASLTVFQTMKSLRSKTAVNI